MDLALTLPESDPITLSGTCKLLGVGLYSKLSWRPHANQIEARAANNLGALVSLSGSMWGTGYRGLRQIYRATVLPQIPYGCSAWYMPIPDDVGYRKVIIERFSSIQARAARLITGAFRATSKTALDIEALTLTTRQNESPQDQTL